LSINKSIDQYIDIIGQEPVDRIKELAGRLLDSTITHVNSTRSGGGVAEILQNLVPLAKSLGLKVRWQSIGGTIDFFNITKKFHNALQGMNIKLTKEMKIKYIKYNEKFSENLDLDSDVVFIHDPQPLPIIKFNRDKCKKFLWRCHLDLTNANTTYWNFIIKFVEQYDALVFSLDKYVHKDVRHKKILIVPPSIDPLSNKNRILSPEEIYQTLTKFDINPEYPIMTQVARFDYWKDPLGVIDCYKIVKKKIPKIQLLMIGSFAQDDPEGQKWYRKTVQKAKNFRRIHVLTDKDGVGDLEVNAFQRASNVVVQKSIREGFGLSVTEALWKGTPVVATRVGGIPLQVINNVTGYLVNTTKECADRTIYLLKHQYLGKILGMEGREHIKRNFLITRHLEDYLKLHLEIIEPN
jgi:trehalose synthase